MELTKPFGYYFDNLAEMKLLSSPAPLGTGNLRISSIQSENAPSSYVYFNTAEAFIKWAIDRAVTVVSEADIPLSSNSAARNVYYLAVATIFKDLVLRPQYLNGELWADLHLGVFAQPTYWSDARLASYWNMAYGTTSLSAAYEQHKYISNGSLQILFGMYEFNDITNADPFYRFTYPITDMTVNMSTYFRAAVSRHITSAYIDEVIVIPMGTTANYLIDDLNLQPEIVQLIPTATFTYSTEMYAPIVHVPGALLMIEASRYYHFTKMPSTCNGNFSYGNISLSYRSKSLLIPAVRYALDVGFGYAGLIDTADGGYSLDSFLSFIHLTTGVNYIDALGNLAFNYDPNDPSNPLTDQRYMASLWDTMTSSVDVANITRVLLVSVDPTHATWIPTQGDTLQSIDGAELAQFDDLGNGNLLIGMVNGVFTYTINANPINNWYNTIVDNSLPSGAPVNLEHFVNLRVLPNEPIVQKFKTNALMIAMLSVYEQAYAVVSDAYLDPINFDSDTIDLYDNIMGDTHPEISAMFTELHDINTSGVLPVGYDDSYIRKRLDNAAGVFSEIEVEGVMEYAMGDLTHAIKTLSDTTDPSSISSIGETVIESITAVIGAIFSAMSSSQPDPANGEDSTKIWVVRLAAKLNSYVNEMRLLFNGSQSTGSTIDQLIDDLNSIYSKTGVNSSIASMSEVYARMKYIADPTGPSTVIYSTRYTLEAIVNSTAVIGTFLYNGYHSILDIASRGMGKISNKLARYVSTANTVIRQTDGSIPAVNLPIANNSFSTYPSTVVDGNFDLTGCVFLNDPDALAEENKPVGVVVFRYDKNSGLTDYVLLPYMGMFNTNSHNLENYMVDMTLKSVRRLLYMKGFGKSEVDTNVFTTDPEILGLNPFDDNNEYVFDYKMDYDDYYDHITDVIERADQINPIIKKIASFTGGDKLFASALASTLQLSRAGSTNKSNINIYGRVNASLRDYISTSLYNQGFSDSINNLLADTMDTYLMPHISNVVTSNDLTGNGAAILSSVIAPFGSNESLAFKYLNETEIATARENRIHRTVLLTPALVAAGLVSKFTVMFAGKIATIALWTLAITSASTDLVGDLDAAGFLDSDESNTALLGALTPLFGEVITKIDDIPMNKKPIR